MKIFGKRELLLISLIILTFIVGVSLYPNLPERLPSHWNAKGEIDSWSGKNFAIFFYPFFTLGMYLLLTFVPLIDPLRKNYAKFAKPYFLFRTVFVSFFLFLYLYTLWAGLGTKININYFIPPVFSFFFIFIGLFLPKVKKNYFVGIRTPWTIHSEEVWDKTHKFGGKVFVVAGLISLLGSLFPNYIFWIFIIPILSAALISVVYSYFAFRKIKRFN